MTVQGTRERSALEARLEALSPGLDVLGLAACVMDTQLRYRYINSAYASQTGRDTARFIGRTPDEIFERVPSDSEVRRDLKRWVPEYQTQVRPKLTAVQPPRAA